MDALKAMMDAKAGNFKPVTWPQAVEIARIRQLAERGDPFVYNRVLSHLVNGICDGVDYEPGRRA